MRSVAVAYDPDAADAIAQRKASQPTRGTRGRGRGRGRGSWRGAAPAKPFANRSLVLSNPIASTSNPTTSTSALPHEVTIDGVVFVSDAAGRKLVRKTAAAESSTSSSSTPTRASVSGQTFVRTKSGNLVALSLVQKRSNAAKVKRMNSMINMTRGAHRSVVELTDLTGRSRGGGRPPPRKVAKLCQFFTSTGTASEPAQPNLRRSVSIGSDVPVRSRSREGRGLSEMAQRESLSSQSLSMPALARLRSSTNASLHLLPGLHSITWSLSLPSRPRLLDGAGLL